jgi:uncharacterized protein (DUF488 family)
MEPVSTTTIQPSQEDRMEIFTIGFTKLSASQFFNVLDEAGITKVVDIRLHNTSQLAGFTKRDDLAFFLDRVSGISYAHEPLLAPTAELLEGFKIGSLSWSEFETAFRSVLRERNVEGALDRSRFEGRVALLCSEPTGAHCHRTIVADYLASAWRCPPVTHL